MQVYKASNPMANNPFVNPEMSKNYFYAFLNIGIKIVYTFVVVWYKYNHNIVTYKFIL